MDKLLELVYDFFKAQLTAHGNEVWLAFLLVGFGMAFIWGMTFVAKGWLKRVKHLWWYDPAVRTMALIFGALYMPIHGIFFPWMFSFWQRVLVGAALGALNIALYHAKKLWDNRKK
jgi:hypothetical protein